MVVGLVEQPGHRGAFTKVQLLDRDVIIVLVHQLESHR